MNKLGRKIRERARMSLFDVIEGKLPFLTIQELQLMKRCIDEWITKKKIVIFQSKK